MNLSPELGAAARGLVLDYHKGATPADVGNLHPLPVEARPDFPEIMHAMTLAAKRVLQKRATREDCIEEFMRNGFARNDAEQLLDLSLATLKQHSRSSSDADGAAAARQNPELASKVAAFAYRQGKVLDRLGMLDRPLTLLLPAAIWGLLVIQYDWRWWTALILAVPAAALVIVTSVLIAGRITTKFAREFHQLWPKKSEDFFLALKILDCIDGVQLKDELVKKIRKFTMCRKHRISKTKLTRR